MTYPYIDNVRRTIAILVMVGTTMHPLLAAIATIGVFYVFPETRASAHLEMWQGNTPDGRLFDVCIVSHAELLTYVCEELRRKKEFENERGFIILNNVDGPDPNPQEIPDFNSLINFMKLHLQEEQQTGEKVPFLVHFVGFSPPNGTAEMLRRLMFPDMDVFS